MISNTDGSDGAYISVRPLMFKSGIVPVKLFTEKSLQREIDSRCVLHERELGER
jgi:hypothetical protein